MGILFDSKEQSFHLKAKDTSYIIKIINNKYLAHLYWGKKLNKVNSENLLKMVARSAFSPSTDEINKALSLDTLPQEYPSYGNSDFRHPAFQVQLQNGSTIIDLTYSNHKIFPGKPILDGLPATYTESDTEAETLEIELVDSASGLKVILSYTAYENFDVITRSSRLVNEGTSDLKVLRALSMGVDFEHCEFDLLHLYGAWSRERHVDKKPLIMGLQSVESRRGASSHMHNPFIALLKKGADEDYGEVYGFNLVYSGNFTAQVEVDQFLTTRVTMGINYFDFTWLLEPGQQFQTPEVVMVYSSEGMGAMSRTYHKLYRTRLCRGSYRDKTRPVLINNWEATYFNFNTEKLLDLANVAKEVGIELFVLDDGWFGKRDSAKCSLGDWFVNETKLPGGLEHLSSQVNSLGMKFGLWVEPEMISPDSDLYRNHPNWCLHVPERARTQGRNQLVLDLSRGDVCEYIVKVLSDILSASKIEYVKWDMNRYMTEIGSECLPAERQRETAHRYMLGLYKILETITSRFPNILFESCAGGGGRFDPGMLHYMPQIWTSDDTDAVERMKIQYGTSIVYPTITMGSHVSAVPNHQVRRMTPLETRGNVASCGNFGYELDLTKLPQEELDIMKKQIAFYHEIKHIVAFGDFYRILNPFDGNETAWMFVTEDKKEALVAYCRVLAIPQAPISKIRLKGLNAEYEYQLDSSDKYFSGDELMYAGIFIPNLSGDYQSILWHFKAK